MESTPANVELLGEHVNFNLNFKKQNFPVEFGLDNTLGQLRLHIAQITGVAAGLQKIMYKDDEKTLKDLGFKEGAKVMLIGSTLTEVLQATVAAPLDATPQAFDEPKKEEPLSTKLPHKKICEKGPPEGAEPGKKGRNDPLPSVPIQNILNGMGTKCRLTFKVFTQELWIQSASDTKKLPFGSIRSVTSEPILNNEEYHLMSLQLGSSEHSRLYLYFVPAQYVRAIKSTIMADYL